MSSTQRYWRIIAAALAVSGLLFVLLGQSPEVWGDVAYGARADDAHWKASMATGSVAVLLLSWTLMLGPWRVLRGGRPRVHEPTRRVAGLAAATMTVVHVGFGITIHSTGWQFWLPFGYPWTRVGFHPRLLGVSFWIALGAVLLLAVVALTSTDSWLQRLGPSRWKLVQRLTYPIYVLVAMHIVTIQLQENRSWGHAAATLAVLAVTVSVQFAGAIRYRSQLRDVGS